MSGRYVVLILGVLLCILGIALVISSGERDFENMFVMSTAMIFLFCLLIDLNFSGIGDPIFMAIANGMGVYWFIKGTYLLTKCVINEWELRDTFNIVQIAGLGLCFLGTISASVHMVFFSDPMYSPEYSFPFQIGKICILGSIFGCLLVWDDKGIDSIQLTGLSIISSLFAEYAIGYRHDHSLRLISAFLPPFVMCSALRESISCVNSEGVFSNGYWGYLIIGIFQMIFMVFLLTTGRNYYSRAEELSSEDFTSGLENSTFGIKSKIKTRTRKVIRKKKYYQKQQLSDEDWEKAKESS
eukprot:c14935_g1_i1.p1 GENE.c14935_g1_i1~~c14935_g1_i1.p1  ORF type:complete len:298 (-),score=78.75 c14935_g1_i1:25-918(-)